MKYWVYPSPVSAVKECLITPEETRLGELPPNIQERFRHAEIWKTITIEKGRKLKGLDADEALRDIEAKGCHIAGIDLSFVEKWPGNKGMG